MHDLVRLAELVTMPEGLFPELDDLSRVYVLTRYPDALPADTEGYGIDRARAEKHLEIAMRALQWVKDKLSTGS